MAAHQAPLSLGFSRQEHWSGLPFPSPMHESEKWKWSRSVMSDSLQPHGLYSPSNSPGQNTGVGSCSLLQGIFTTQGSNPGLLHCRWIPYQLSHKGSTRILEWVSQSVQSLSRVRLFVTPPTIYSLWNSAGQNTGVGSCSLLQGIFLTQGSNPGLSHCRQILYHLSHHGSPSM